MKVKREKSIRRRMFAAFTIVSILMIPIAYLLGMYGMEFAKEREKTYENLRQSITETFDNSRKELQSAAEKAFDKNLSSRMNMLTALLKNYVSQNGYGGPGLLPHGFVVTLQGRNVILPEGAPVDKAEISRSRIDKGVSSGALRTARAVIDGDGEDEPQSAYLSFVEISGNIIYVDVLPEAVYESYISRFTANFSTLDGEVLPKMSLTSARMRSFWITFIMCYTIGLILCTMIVYVMGVQRYVRENVVTEAQSARYNPHRLRGSMMNAGLIGVVVTMLVAMLLQGVGQLHLELQYGRYALNIFSKQVDQAEQQRGKVLQTLQEEWYVSCGEEMAALLSQHPEFATNGNLQSCCDALDIDFIMLFDDQGSETLCNRDYIGFTLDSSLGRNSSDFRRLLYGMPSIVHSASADSITGLERQMIGVKLPATGDEGQPGALIMALLPDQTREYEGLYQVNEHLALLNVNGPLCFSANATTGVIDHSSDPALLGRNVVDCGLSQQSLKDGYMDFGVINGVKRFIVTMRKNNNIDYYSPEFQTLFDRVMKYAGLCALLLAVSIGIILFFTLRDYDDATFAEWAVVRMQGEELEVAKLRRSQKQLGTVDTPPEKAGGKRSLYRSILEKVDGVLHWNEKLPEEKAKLVFKTSFLIHMILCVNLMLGENTTVSKYDTLAGFLLQGDWMRGLNLFSLCSILLVIGLAYVIVVITNGLMLLLSGFLLGKGQTFCRLIYSFVKYFALFVTLYFALNYLGFPIGTVVGSLSITTVALSLGAKDLAADILAGLSIVFEQTFQVGDIIEINGQRGRVQEIGVRTTRLIIPVNNVLIISNHAISDVINLTRDVSLHTLELKVDASETLERLEEVINRELPGIQKRNDNIIELNLIGVTDLGSKTGLPNTSTMTLTIGAYCQQGDMYNVRVYLNREIKLLCEREGIVIK